MIALLLAALALGAPAHHHRRHHRCVPPPITVRVDHPNRPIRIVVPLDPCQRVGPERGN